MYRIELDMNLTDFAVSRAIRELSECEKNFSQRDIAVYLGCGPATVNRSCNRLIKAGVIEMVHLGGVRFTYRYLRDTRLEVLSSA